MKMSKFKELRVSDEVRLTKKCKAFMKNEAVAATSIYDRDRNKVVRQEDLLPYTVMVTIGNGAYYKAVVVEKLADVGDGPGVKVRLETRYGVWETILDRTDILSPKVNNTAKTVTWLQLGSALIISAFLYVVVVSSMVGLVAK